MTQQDLFYRAFLEYRKSLGGSREISSLRDAVVQADEEENITVTRAVCHVEEDWVEAVERGLVFIGKAIDEERQFIRSSGEVEPIEKVKHVSRETVEHLARHSSLITRVPEEGEDLMPEKLYTVERLNNYAVYENRFLYMMLCRLNDFISLRYNRIIKESGTYRGELSLQKTVTSGKRRFTFEAALRESREGDAYMQARSGVGETLNRLERMQRTVYYYLHTPLMTEVAKADKLKPPITKTNILRMDKNFKEVVALYEFLLAYDKDGFTVREEKTSPAMKDGKIPAELAEPVLLLSFLTYEHGMGIQKELAAAYEEEEARRREEARLREKEQLENLRRRLREGGVTPEEYILQPEKRCRALEKDAEKLRLTEAELAERVAEVASLKEEVAAREAEIAAVKQAHAEELAARDALEESLRRRIEEQAVAHAAALMQAEREKQEAIERLTAEKEEALAALLAQKEEELAQLSAAHREALDESEARFAEKSGELASLQGSFASLTEAHLRTKARLLALRAQHGLLTDADDYTSEEAFTELEREIEALGSVLLEQWKGAKRLLRRAFFASLKETVKKPGKKKGAPPAEAEDVQKETAPEEGAAAPPAKAEGGQKETASEEGAAAPPAEEETPAAVETREREGRAEDDR